MIYPNRNISSHTKVYKLYIQISQRRYFLSRALKHQFPHTITISTKY